MKNLHFLQDDEMMAKEKKMKKKLIYFEGTCNTSINIESRFYRRKLENYLNNEVIEVN